MNKAIIYGNLTRDPELKALPSGGSVASFGVATNRRVKKDEQWVDVPEFHNIVVFGKQADSCASHLTKGSSVLIEGRIQTRSWETDDKGKQYRTEIVGERVQFGQRAKQEPSEEEENAANAETAGSEDINPDDIPF